ncbi:MAG: sortase [Nocardiopsaceae bacterium]|nr:sortase [Nocardiopsaceae bacterium]
MTQTISPSAPDSPSAPEKPSAPEQAPVKPPEPAAPQPAKDVTAQGIGVGLILLGVFLLGFLGYLFGLSSLQEARAQSNAFATFRAKLAQQIAPLKATTPGAPVAILNIPAIGIKNMIVVEGTSPTNLELGPGHVRNSPLPGENGVTEIFGRRATFGAPFGRLPELHRGDKVQFITGQGKSSYTIIAKGDSGHLVKDPAPNRLLLLTACSKTIPATYCYFDAELTTTPQQDPGGRPVITASETPLSGDFSVLVLTMVWGIALVMISVAGTVAAARWSPRLAYMVTAPLALAVLWNLYQSLAALLPNVY